ncbi:hypothetical protein GCM10023107_27220 [Actinoplanes octamycinicus]
MPPDVTKYALRWAAGCGCGFRYGVSGPVRGVCAESARGSGAGAGRGSVLGKGWGRGRAPGGAGRDFEAAPGGAGRDFEAAPGGAGRDFEAAPGGARRDFEAGSACRGMLLARWSRARASRRVSPGEAGARSRTG